MISNKAESLLKECNEVKQLYLDVRTSKDQITQLLETEKQKHSEILLQKESLTNQLEEKQHELNKLKTTVESLRNGKIIM